jgi:putative transposase
VSDKLPQRSHPVHGIKYVAGQPTIIFDTLCVKHRRHVLATEAFHEILRKVAGRAKAWLIGRYVIMPDHIHFFAGDVDGAAPYENWVRYLKSQLTKACRQALEHDVREGEAPAEPPRQSLLPAQQELRPPGPARVDQFQWLTDHWDTRVRSAEVYEQKWAYVWHNPVRAGFVARPEDWPFQGEIHPLRWR